MQAQTQRERSAAYCTVREAADYTRLSLANLYVHMAAGRLPFYKIGKSRRLAWADIEDFMRRHTSPSPVKPALATTT
jgi:excisionase family DNA binding protein